MLRKTMVVVLSMLGMVGALVLTTEPLSASSSSLTDFSTAVLGTYRDRLAEWEQEDPADNGDFSATITADEFTVCGPALDPHGYDGPAATFDDLGKITLSVTVQTAGLYRFSLDFFPLDTDYLDYEMAVLVNGVSPYSEAGQIILYKYWVADGGFSTDRYGNDFYGSQMISAAWFHQDFLDPMGLYADPLSFRLEAGANTIEIDLVKGAFLVGDFTVTGLSGLPAYAAYAASALVTDGTLQTYEAETPTAKNSSSIQPGVSRDLEVTPFAVSELKLNILAGTTWNSERETVQYAVSVPEAGWYHLAFKVNQSDIVNGAVFRTLRLNGEIPFAEAQTLGIGYAGGWQNFVPSDASGTPYLFHLEAGTNTISLSVDLSPFRETYYVIKTVMQQVNQLSLDIKKLTGNQLDENRDWAITDYLPDVVSNLQSMADALQVQMDHLDAINLSDKASEPESALKIAIRNLEFLAQKPNDIPKNITLLATSSSSVASTLGNIVSLLLNSPLDLDKLYVYGEAELPEPNAGFFAKAWLSIKRFFLSFFEERYSDKASADELEVWVNRSKQYVDLIQKMADDSFTAQTGIKVKVSVMASEGKLILANSAGQNPDVAVGIASWLPYDMGIRGAVYDLSAFRSDPGFAETLSLFPAESLIPMVYDNGLYGLPDTENFYVLFYRTDIFATLGLDVPDTWEAVTELMPKLRRYGMNLYIPLSSATSLKSFDSTLPFLFQYGSAVYDADAFGTALDDNASIAALTMMTELYTIYSMDVTVSSFYNDFRLGLCPIGVGDFGMYITLLNAAPDIQGLWKIALLPGVDKGNGTIDRSAPGAQTANIIFKNTDKAADSWEFLQWWASTTTQSEFSNLMLSTLGKEYLWNSANTQAFMNAGYADADLAIILEQWSWLKELPKVPGSYQVELEISNLWNSVVLDRANLRVELNDAILRADKEIKKKMSEFGYVDQLGNILKPYPLGTASLIETWIQGGGAGE